MTLDEVVKQLTELQHHLQLVRTQGPNNFVDGKIAGIGMALSLITKAEPPAETELERRAWEIYRHNCTNWIGPAIESFEWASEWMDERDKRRAGNATTD